ncbi:MAG: SusC/RagA family TonB-linked outer membrane protein [Cytophagaceae bacterium SCN 52-12]|nr:MAG: SusC/RagA family TonB-linked outer membrane protein [Cytophagaceae bacterium SCN 52-12]
MRLKHATLLVLISCLHVFASGHAQRISLSVRNSSMLEVMDQIEKQTGYSFWLQTDLLKDKSRVTVRVKNGSLTTLLDQLLIQHGLRYTIIDKTIVVMPAGEKSSGVVKEQLPAGRLENKPLAERIQWPERIEKGERKVELAFRVEHEVKGKVLDENGSGLPGVSVVVKGTQRGISTDMDGLFTLAVPGENAVLVFSFVGYATQEILVGNRSSIEVTMNPDLKSLEELVVIGYGVVKKSDLTGSVSQVKAKELNAFPNANVLQSLSGRAPGVHIRQSSGAPGAGISVRVRGGNSIQGSNDPLYVIDGFPVDGNPTHLNNSDIESLEILKDASATAIYGSRGANGVVIITTKRGKKGRTNVDFETSYSSQKLIRKLDLMNAKEYAQFYNEQAINDNIQPFFSQQDIDGFGEGFDWQDFVFRQAPIVTSSLNVSGGNEKTIFSITGSVFGQQGIIKGSDYNRYSLQTNISHKAGDRFTIDLTSTISRLATERKDSGGGSRGNSMIAAAISAPPTLSPYNEDGSYRILSTAYPFIATDIRNPINFINERKSMINANVLLANLGLSYKITPDLTLKVTGGIENRDDRTDNYTTRKYYNSNGIASAYSGQFTSLLNENTLNYIKTLGEKHSINAVAGVTFQNFLQTRIEAGGTGFLSDIFETYNIQAAANQNVSESGYIKWVLASFIGRVNYVYDNRYLLTASIRRDGASVYSPGSKWGYFPSAAFAWRVSNEDFLVDNRVISDLKLRTSWGITGSPGVTPYMTLNNLEPNRTIFNDAFANTFAPGTRLPGNLKWETTAQFDAGADLGLFNNRLLLTLDYYVKNTRDLLSVVSLPSSLGYTSTVMNVGKVQNKGFELGLDALVLKQGDFTWDVNANIAFNRNKVVSLYGGEDILRDNIGVIIVNDATGILREGRPVGQFWGYKEAGYDSNGFIVFKDLNEDGAITQADKTYIGDANPDFIYGLSSNLTYKGFEFNMFWQGSQGNDIFNASAITNTMDYGFGLNMPRSVFYNHWTPDSPDAQYPKISLRSPVRMSDRFIEDGSYLRLKNISIGYNLASELIRSKALRNLYVYVSGQNLLTFTGYSWWDPETNYRIDHNSYPVAKSVTVGVRVGF